MLRLIFLLPAIFASTAAAQYFAISVVDDQTGRGVPLVELETTNNQIFITDSAGLIAFNEPGLMDREVYFHVRSHGYEYPKDGFGFRGVRLTPRVGQTATVKIRRVNVAERLYRQTGQGIYRDSVLLGRKPPTANPVINGLVMGQDSVATIVYRGKIFWFWGDTGRTSYPLGNFSMSGATSELPSRGGLPPGEGVNLNYFTDETGFSRKMCPWPEPGMMWLDGFMTLPDDTGRERLVARYCRMKSLGETLEQGLVLYNDTREIFEKWTPFDLKERRIAKGQAFHVAGGAGDYYYFPFPYPNLRVRAQWKQIGDPANYEAFTCLAPGSRFSKSAPKLDRSADGKLLWSWKRDADPITPAEQKELIAGGHMKQEEAWYRLKDVESGKPVQIHASAVHWNEFRKRWIMIGEEIGGTSLLGELWYSEAEAPEGPWERGRKIVTHDKYTFYNPAHHTMFDEQGGRFIYFEATYTAEFSGNPIKTPRYDYNQIMYRLDLSDPRLKF